MTGNSLVLPILDATPDCCILRAGTLRLPGGVGRYWARSSWASEVCCTEHNSTLPREVFLAGRDRRRGAWLTRQGCKRIEDLAKMSF